MSAVTALELVLIVFCVLWNAFFVAAEYAFVSVRHTRLDELVAEGNRRARTVRKIVADPSHFIAAMQLGITLSSLALGALGEPAVARVLDSAFGSVSSGRRDGGLGGRRVPRHLDPARRDRRDRAEVVHAAARRAGRARGRARRSRVFFFIVRLVHHVPRLARPARHAHARHQDDRRARGARTARSSCACCCARASAAGVLEPDEQQMIDKVFDFSDTPVEDVMVPRPDIVALPVALTPTAAMEQVLQHPYTRYPVYDDEFDNVLGVLHVRRLFVALQNGAARQLRSARAALPGAPRARDQAPRPPADRDPPPEGPHGDRGRRVRLGRRASSRSRTCSRRSSARSTTSSIPRTRRSCASGPTATASRAACRSRSSTSASSATSPTTTTTRSAASSSASSGARRRSATASRSATSSSTSPPSTARASCTPTRRCCRCPSADDDDEDGDDS